MKKQNKKKKNYNKFITTFFTIFLIFSTIFIIYAVALYKSIETPIRIIGCLTLVVLSTLLWSLLMKFQRYKKQKVFIFLSLICLIYSTTLSFFAIKANTIYKKFANISNSTYSIYSTSVIIRSSDNTNTMNNIKNGKIGIINNEQDSDGYNLSTKILKEHDATNTIRYNSYEEMVNDLLNNKIDYALVPTHYESMLSNTEGFNNISEKTKIIYTEEEKKEKKITTKSNKSLDEPFTVLIMGVDTVNDGFTSGFNGDALILVTFNPNTTNATILSIPRDTYMPISCMNGRKNKITNAGWQGEECIINSLEDYFDIDIDYHIKINFNGVVQLVDTLGGVEIDVPYSFCEQDSKRRWGKNTIFVDSGEQTLNGEQALAFARHRKVTQYMVNYCGSKYITNSGYWNDFTRGQNQQIIINALLKKLKNIDDFSTIENLLDTISNNVETDISIDNILSLYNTAKSIITKSSNKDEALSMQKLYLDGEDTRIYDYSFKTNSGTRLSLYNYNIYVESKNAVVDAMKENLGLKEVITVKRFNYSIKDDNQEYIIGKNEGTTSDLILIPNFIGLNVSIAEKFASENNVHLNINYVTGTIGQQIGQILTQDIPSGTDVDMLDSSHTITLSVVDSISNTYNNNNYSTDDDDDDIEDDNSSSIEDNTITDIEEIDEDIEPEELVQENQESITD